MAPRKPVPVFSHHCHHESVYHRRVTEGSGPLEMRVEPTPNSSRASRYFSFSLLPLESISVSSLHLAGLSEGNYDFTGCGAVQFTVVVPLVADCARFLIHIFKALYVPLGSYMKASGVVGAI